MGACLTAYLSTSETPGMHQGATLGRDSSHKALLDAVHFCRAALQPVSLPTTGHWVQLCRAGWGGWCHSRACKCCVGGLSLLLHPAMLTSWAAASCHNSKARQEGATQLAAPQCGSGADHLPPALCQLCAQHARHRMKEHPTCPCQSWFSHRAPASAQPAGVHQARSKLAPGGVPSASFPHDTLPRAAETCPTSSRRRYLVQHIVSSFTFLDYKLFDARRIISR